MTEKVLGKEEEVEGSSNNKGCLGREHPDVRLVGYRGWSGINPQDCVGVIIQYYVLRMDGH